MDKEILHKCIIFVDIQENISKINCEIFLNAQVREIFLNAQVPKMAAQGDIFSQKQLKHMGVY